MIGNKIKELREKKEIFQQELADALSVSKSTVAMWETNKREPDLETINKIAAYFSVPTDYLVSETIKLNFFPREIDDDNAIMKCPICGYDYIHFIRSCAVDFENPKSTGVALEFHCEDNHTFYYVVESFKGNTFFAVTDGKHNLIKKHLISNDDLIINNINKKYRTLDGYGKKAVDSVLDVEYERCTTEPEQSTIEIQLCTLPVSAGTGEFLSDEMSKIITIPDTPLNRSADFIVEVSGDSMLPEYKNEDYLLVHKQETVEMGEIGIFVVNGCGYVKKFGGDRLISLNKKYDDITFGEYDNVVCYGKVMGKVM